jgi:hypothetical protein
MADPSIKDIAYRTAAGVFGGPVDLATMVMRPFGYKTPDTQVMGGSEWIGKKLEDAGMISSARAPVTEFLTSMAVPTPGGIAKGAALAAPMIGGMFVGKGARTWDAIQASKAKMLADMGTDARTIWKETGTWKGPDGKWRQEIDDSSAQLENLSALKAKDKSAFEAQRTQLINEVKEQGGKPTDMQKFRMNQINNQAGISDAYRGVVGDVLKSDPLYSAYPSKADIPFNWMEMPTGTKGEYSPQSGVALNMGTFGDEAKSFMLHELQHGIQQKEGFARGGSPESAIKLISEAKIKEAEKLWPKFQKLEKSFKAGDTSVLPQMNLIEKQINQIYDVPEDPYKAYLRLAGEAEARATQSRMNMTPAQRRAMFPEESYDVPMNELIIRGSGD